MEGSVKAALRRGQTEGTTVVKYQRPNLETRRGKKVSLSKAVRRSVTSPNNKALKKANE